MRPCDIDLAVRTLQGSSVKAGAVCGFPHGSQNTATKLYEARDLLRRGAREIDMVIAISKLLSREFQHVQMELLQISESCHKEGALLKVILENAYLTDELKIIACRCCERAEVDFVKTSTGFADSGYTLAGHRADAQVPPRRNRHQGRRRDTHPGPGAGSLSRRVAPESAPLLRGHSGRDGRHGWRLRLPRLKTTWQAGNPRTRAILVFLTIQWRRPDRFPAYASRWACQMFQHSLEHARREAEAGELFLEFRLDYLSNPCKGAEAIPIFSNNFPDCILLATCRRHQNHGKFNGSIEEQLAVLDLAVRNGAHAIDIEIETAEVAQDKSESVPRPHLRHRLLSQFRSYAAHGHGGQPGHEGAGGRV